MRIFRPLRGAPVALLWGGLSLSALGDQFYAVALTWIAIGVLGSNAGYLAALQAFIALVMVLWIGKWADRLDQGRGMIAADLARAAVLLTVVVVWLESGGPSIAQLITVIVVLAAGQAVFQPALQSMLPSVVDNPGLLPAANGLLDGTDRSARLLGPGLVALLAGIVPMVHFLTLDALSFLASSTALMCIVRRRPVARTRGLTAPAERTRETIWRGMVRGGRATVAHPLLGYLLATTGLLNGIWYAVFYLCLPLIIARHGPGSNGESGLSAYGLILSIYGCANLATNVIVGSRELPDRPQFQMFGGNLLVGAGMVLLGPACFLPSQWMLPGLAAAATLSAIGGPMKDIPLAVLRQTHLDPADMAAAMRIYMAMNSAGTLLAMLIVPVAFIVAGNVPVVIACGLGYLAVGGIGLFRHAGWVESGRELPT